MGFVDEMVKLSWKKENDDEKENQRSATEEKDERGVGVGGGGEEEEGEGKQVRIISHHIKVSRSCIQSIDFPRHEFM